MYMTPFKHEIVSKSVATKAYLIGEMIDKDINELFYQVTVLVRFKGTRKEYKPGIAIVSPREIIQYGFTEKQAEEASSHLPFLPWDEFIGVS